MGMIKRLVRAIGIALFAWALVILPVLAISNPDSNPTFYAIGSSPTYNVFYDVSETGDMLFVAEELVDYAVTPNETASEAFLFQILNTTGNATIAAVPLNAYGAKPISIYMSATQVTSNGISVGDNLTIRVTGNPLLFASSTNNTVSAVLSPSDYIDQDLGVDGGIATNNMLRNFLIEVAQDLETYDSPPAGGEYITTVTGTKYLTTIGGNIFIQGIPSLDALCPILFQYSIAPIAGDKPDSTGAYQSANSPLAKWGETSSNGLTNLGIYFGLSPVIAGMAMLLVFASALAIYAYIKTQSGLVALLLVGATPFVGATMGLMPIALAFVVAIALTILLGFYFFSKGAL